MSQIELKYNHKKIALYIVFIIILIVFFINLYLNSHEISLKKPGSGKYSWVGHLFYENETLLSTSLVIFILLFSYTLFRLVELLFRKSMVIKIISNEIYVNQKKVESVSNINNTSFIDINNNKQIHLYYKKSRSREIANYFPIFKNKFKKTKYVIDFTFIKENPEDVNKLLNDILQQ